MPCCLNLIKRIAPLVIALLTAIPTITAATVDPLDSEAVEKATAPRAFRGKYRTVIDGDTVTMVVFNEITVFPPLKFKNKKEEEFYWRTVRDVKRTLPYAKLICETLKETYEYLQTFDTKEERDKYLKDMESAVFEEYKPALKKFTKNQAKTLVKLIQRETDQNGYDILKAFLGSFRATFWKGFGKIFGVNISDKYKPDSDRKDAIIERVATLVEQGQL